MAVEQRIALRRSTAVIDGDRITVRPSRGQLIAPAIQVGIALAALALLIAFFDALPLLVLALLLVVVMLFGPVAVLGFVFGLFGSSMVVDGAKGSAHWQQGFLGLGIGTTTSVPFARIVSVEVNGDYDADLTYGGRADMVTWDVELVRDDERRLQVGSVVVARPTRRRGARAREPARRRDQPARPGRSATRGAPARGAARGQRGVRARAAAAAAAARAARGAPAARGGEPVIVDGDRAWELLRDHRSIAVVARSARLTRPWYGVTQYLIEAGYDVQIVNPLLRRALGRRCYDSIAELPRPVEIVDVFRRVPEVPAVVEDASPRRRRSCGYSSRSCTKKQSRAPRRPGCRWSSIAARRSSTRRCSPLAPMSKSRLMPERC